MKHQYRISKVVMTAMLFAAGAADLLQLASGTFPLAAGLGSAAVSWIPLLGQFLSFTLFTTGSLMHMAFSLMVAVFAYGGFGLWFILEGVPVFGGKHAGAKAGILMLMLLIGTVPFLSLLPDITTWVATHIYFSRVEDKAKEKENELLYNGGNVARTKRMRRRYVPHSE